VSRHCPICLPESYTFAQIIFQDVDGMGTAGTIAKVNHGYARNYLIPNKLAAVRRGKQSGSVADIQEYSNASSISAAATAASGGVAASGALNEEEREKLMVAQQRRRLESAVKKLTTQTLVRPRSFFLNTSMQFPSFSINLIFIPFPNSLSSL
jgi:ribosomal protein L9